MMTSVGLAYMKGYKEAKEKAAQPQLSASETGKPHDVRELEDSFTASYQ